MSEIGDFHVIAKMMRGMNNWRRCGDDREHQTDGEYEALDEDWRFACDSAVTRHARRSEQFMGFFRESKHTGKHTTSLIASQQQLLLIMLSGSPC